MLLCSHVCLTLSRCKVATSEVRARFYQSGDRSPVGRMKEMKQRYSVGFNITEDMKYLGMRHKCEQCWACMGRLHLQRGDERCSFSRRIRSKSMLTAPKRASVTTTSLQHRARAEKGWEGEIAQESRGRGIGSSSSLSHEARAEWG
jgi:hypothetical protein